MTASVPRRTESWTFDDLYDLPDDGNRYELVEGRLLVSAAPARPHFRTLTLLHELLIRRKADGFAVGQNAGVIDGPRRDTYFIPDLIVVSEEVLAGDAVAFVPTEILLTVEVLSPSGRSTDEVTKRYHYARMGVPQYWIVDPVARVMNVLLLDAHRRIYRDVATVEAGERWKTEEPFPIECDPAEFC